MARDDGMRRREFLKTAVVGSAGLAVAGCPAEPIPGLTPDAGAPAGDRGPAFADGFADRATPRDAAPADWGQPNVLLIMADEHNPAVLGAAGNPVMHSPNLDGLAAQGVLFDGCYCNSPLCVPSRLSFTAGKYASRVGAWNNDCWLPSADYPSVARSMNAAGYESYLCGKMHYDKTRRYGFTEIGGEMNNGTKTGRGARRDPDDLAPKAGISERFADFKEGATSSVIEHDQAVTKGVTAFLQQRRAGDKPFFLVAGYLAPHFPLIVPAAYHQRYVGQVPLPVIPAGHLAGQPLNYQHLRIAFNVEDVPNRIVREGRELYYGLVEWLDAEIGTLLQALAASALAEDTVVIYTADHGENMGEHGLWWKNCMYEHAARVPLIVRWPRRWPGGQRRSGACSLVDVTQTIVELGRGAAGADWNGDSLCGWLDDPQHAWKDRAVSEYYGHNVASGFAMLRQGRHKYVYHTRPDATHPRQRELYDLQADPGELTNLAADPANESLWQPLHQALVQEIGEGPEATEARCRTQIAKGYPAA